MVANRWQLQRSPRSGLLLGLRVFPLPRFRAGGGVTLSAFPNIPQITLHGATSLKSSLVDLGIHALNRGEWQMVMAITRLIEHGGMRHD
jgi:hypothetical protein